MALRISSLPLQLMRYASPHLRTLYHLPPSARLQLNAAASSYKEEAGNENDDGFIAAAAKCVPVEVDAPVAVEQLGKAKRGALLGYPHEGQPSQPKDEGSRRETRLAMSSPTPPGAPVEGHGGSGGDHH